jgi:uncharacterized protein
MGVSDDDGGAMVTRVEVLDHAACWSLLTEAPVGRLAVSIAEHPDIFPINHVVDDGAVLFRTAAGTKLAGAVLGRAVAYEVDGYEAETGTAWSVVLKGTAEELDRLVDLMDASELPLFPWLSSPKTRWVRITPTQLTGRRFVVAADAKLSV